MGKENGEGECWCVVCGEGGGGSLCVRGEERGTRGTGRGFNIG